jgi:hypothetical protein
MCSFYILINPEMNSGMLHLEVIVTKKTNILNSKAADRRPISVWKYQNMILLRPDCVKNGNKCWVLSNIRKPLWKLYFWEKFYFWQIAPSFFISITLMILVFDGEDCEYLFRRGTSFFLDNTFKSPVRQSVELYVWDSDSDLKSTSHDNYIYLVSFALLPDKKEKCIIVLTLIFETTIDFMMYNCLTKT